MLKQKRVHSASIAGIAVILSSPRLVTRLSLVTFSFN